MPITPNKDLVKFILESRKRGFDDFQIREPLIKKGWPAKLIAEAFDSITEKENKKIKNSYTIYLDKDIVYMIEKRAKKNMLNFNEQIEDILRRSCLSQKKSKGTEEKNLDDKFIALFSRRNMGRKKDEK
jgi:GTPase Era involved in 16S rRNA processing